MNKVYRHKALASDQYLGRVGEDGNVFESRLGPDKMAGRVDLSTGKVYESRFGPDKFVGRVDPKNGKVYLPRLGPDEYLGKIDPDGRCFFHKRLARDEYIGKVTDMVSFAHAGGGFLLLLLPLMERIAEEVEESQRQKKELERLEDEDLPDGAGAANTG
jgi:hypothetical protein